MEEEAYTRPDSPPPSDLRAMAGELSEGGCSGAQVWDGRGDPAVAARERHWLVAVAGLGESGREVEDLHAG